MINPWESVPLETYEEHMQLQEIYQLQTLCTIMWEQFEQYPKASAAIVGIAGGNGLEHVYESAMEIVYGIDINEEYLKVCRKRHKALGDRLELICADLSAKDAVIPPVSLVIANLFVEYVGEEVFSNLMGRAKPDIVSCVVQQSDNASFVSSSPYAEAFADIASIHRDIDGDALTEAMCKQGFALLMEKAYPLPNGKTFLRLDYGRNGYGVRKAATR